MIFNSWQSLIFKHEMWIKNLYLTNRFFVVLAALILLYVLEYLLVLPVGIAGVCLIVFGLMVSAETVLLFRNRLGLQATRTVPERLSNGDENVLRYTVINRYLFPVSVEVIDELPEQLQIRNFGLDLS